MPNLVSPLTAEIQAQYPGATISRRGYDYAHYDLKNGESAFVQVLGGLHYWDGATWQELNTDFTNSNRQGYQDNNGTAQFLADVDSNTGRYVIPRRDTAGEYFTLGRPQYWTGSQWRNLNMPGRVRSGQQLTWDSAAIAFSIQHSGHGIKYNVTLKTNTYATNVRWAYTLTGLHWNTAAGHEWELISNSSGKVVGIFRVPTLTDSSSIDDPVVRPVAANHNGGYITFTPDYSGLVYPVYVDPTFTDGYGGDTTTAADDGVYSVSANNNYGVSTTGWTLATTKGLTRFNLSSLTNVASVSSATLSLFHAAKSTNSAWTLTVYSVASGNSTWIEGTKDGATAGTGEPCWSYKAYNTVAWAGSAGLSTADTDYESSAMGTVSGNRSDNVGTQYDVALNTTRVKAWCGASNTNYGLLSTISAASGGLCTSDHATTGYRPKLVVKYSVTLALAQGSYTLTGQTVGLSRTWYLALGSGSVGLTGKAVGLTASRVLGFAQGAYTLTGEAVGLTKGTAPKVLVMTQGAFTLTGEATGLIASRKLGLGQGAFTLTGENVGLVASRKLALVQGTLALTGEAVGLTASRTLGLAQGAFTLTGEATGLLVSRLLALGSSAYLLTGEPVVLVYIGGATYVLALASGSFALAGENAGLVLSRQLDLGQGAISLTGNALRLWYLKPTPAGRANTIGAAGRSDARVSVSRSDARGAASRTDQAGAAGRTDTRTANSRTDTE